MAVPLVLMAAGTLMQIAGQYSANMAQALEEEKNAAFYREQAKYARQSALRAEDLAGFEYTYKIGQQVGDYAASGVDAGSGSAAVTVGGSIAQFLGEISAIRKKGDLDVKLATMRGVSSDRTANILKSDRYNIMQAGTTLLSGFTKSEGYGILNSDREGLTDKYTGWGNYTGESYNSASGAA